MLKSSKITLIRPPGRFPIPNVAHLWEAREVLLRFGVRDITLRYRQTALGAIWVIIQPLLSAGIFTVVFGHVAKLPSGGVPYFLFSFSGMLVWNMFSGIMARATSSLVANSALVSKVFFPRILVPTSVICSVLVDFVVAFVFMIVLLIGYRVSPGWGVVALPIWVLLVCMSALGFGYVLAPLMARYRDVQYVLPFLIQIGLYASPIAYSIDAVPSRYKPFFNLNPITWFLEEFRWSTLGRAAPPLEHVVASIVFAAVVFVGGALMFERMERTLADVI